MRILRMTITFHVTIRTRTWKLKLEHEHNSLLCCCDLSLFCIPADSDRFRGTATLELAAGEKKEPGSHKGYNGYYFMGTNLIIICIII